MYLQQEIEGGRRNLALGEPLAAGGEARIYALRDHPGLVAKVYHTASRERSAKLTVMLTHPPADVPRAVAAIEAQGHASIAWPVHLLRRDHSVAGFVMPRARGMRPVFEFYNPKSRREQTPQFSWLYLHRAGRNLAAAVNSLHVAGYVIGDVNESNILVSDRALVTLVDTDSFQVRDPGSSRIFRCQVGKPEFTPPELQGVSFSDVTRAPEHDLFGLGVILFQLLMEGTHPFAGRFTGTGEPPPYEGRIARGHFPYSSLLALPYEPMPLAPPLAILHPPIAALFERCFVQGHHQPKARPTADEWQRALADAEAALAVCSVNSQHRFGFHLPICPWCQRSAQLGGRDPFPRPGTQPRKPPTSKRPSPPVPRIPRNRPLRPQFSSSTMQRRPPASKSTSPREAWRSGAMMALWLAIMAFTRLDSCSSPPTYKSSAYAETERNMDELRERIRNITLPPPPEKPPNAERIRAGLAQPPATKDDRRLVLPRPAEHVYASAGNCLRCGMERLTVTQTNKACVAVPAVDRAPLESVPNLKLDAGAPRP